MRKDGLKELSQKIDNLKEEIIKHNSEVVILDKLLDKITINYARRYFISPNPIQSINPDDYGSDNQKYDVLKKFLSNVWIRIIKSIDKPTNIRTIEEKIDNDLNKNIRFRKEVYPFRLSIEPGTRFCQVSVGWLLNKRV